MLAELVSGQRGREEVAVVRVVQRLAVVDRRVGAEEVEHEFVERVLGGEGQLDGNAAQGLHVVVADGFQRHVFRAAALGHGIGRLVVARRSQAHVGGALGHGGQVAVATDASALLRAEVVDRAPGRHPTPGVQVGEAGVHGLHAARDAVAQRVCPGGAGDGLAHHAQALGHATQVAVAQLARETAVAGHLDIALPERLHIAVLFVRRVEEASNISPILSERSSTCGPPKAGTRTAPLSVMRAM